MNVPVHDNANERLRAAIVAFPGQRFAVIDGGHFDDLPRRLKSERLFARSLFLDQGDPEIRKAGPWLLGLDQAPKTTDRVLAVVADKPAVVFWCCEAGEAVLYRHLRTISIARIPLWAADGKGAPDPSDDRGASKAAFFRHFDPRVLGALMPCLDAAQFSRFLGPAEEVAFAASSHGGLRRIVADRSWPPAPPGMLSIRSEQAEALIGRRSEASRQRIAAYLREHAPEMTEHTSEQQLLDLVAVSEAHGRGLGLESEAAHGRWAYLVLRSEKRILEVPRVDEYIRNGGRHPDDQVEELLRQTALEMRRVELRSGYRGPS